MRPVIEDLRRLAPDLAPDLLREHLDRLEDNYFQAFTTQQIVAQLRQLSALSHDHPVEVIFATATGGRLACTILAFDYASVFSLITGLLSASGFNILSGEIFTSKRTDISRRVIIDHFVGRLTPGTDAAVWSQDLQRHLQELLPRLESGKSENAARARHLVNEMVAARLAALQQDDLPVLYPVHIEAAPLAGYTRLRVLSQDTPAFLYAMSSALALQGISIERVRIRTTAGRITDEIDVLDRQGRPLTEPDKLDQLKFTVLLTKQFTYFLAHAPDPYTALCRFEQMVENIIQAPRQGEWLALLSRPDTLQELARLLGASDFIWEDFIRLQYETLLPILQPHLNGRNLAHAKEEQAALLRASLSRTEDSDEQCRLLNEFKDRELFLSDLDHILDPRMDVRAFAESLTALAELVIAEAADIVFRSLTVRYGQPRTVAGLPLTWAIFGLGKFGGAAMGYASDIELLLIYSDNGRTDGRESVSNAEFFNAMARGLTESVRAKREGIFHIDLRLRPYGNSGPLACSLESFCRYYAPGAPAHAYERLALVRMRAVAGDQTLGARVERLRDEFIYAGQHIDLEALQALRRRQFDAKTTGGQANQNAKFSPGALVDLEYDVQILQVMHAANTPSLRTPRIHQALAALADLGVLTSSESRELTGAYYFLRRLINGLRMLRGSARDLNLPPPGSPEFTHLARRMGYRRGEPLEPEQQLRVEFATQTAIVRAFVENHFGRSALPGPPDGNLADLVLSGSIPESARERVLALSGFNDTRRADDNLRRLAGDGARRDSFARLAVLAGDTLKHSADPDMALNNWERFVAVLPDAAAHYNMLLSQPRRLEILLGIFAASQFLADTLIRNPEFLDWVTSSAIINAQRSMSEIENGLRNYIAASAGDWRDAVRRFRRREILRTGARDICLHAPLREVTADITALATSVIRVTLDNFWTGQSGAAGPPRRFCVLAFGKLGGRELNYSSDIDLLGFCDGEGVPEVFNLAMRQIAGDLAGHTAEGYAYRVDFRLRPYGGSGQLVYPLDQLVQYYRQQAQLWEIQALLKARPVAGDRELGRQFIASARQLLRKPYRPELVADSIHRLRMADHRRRTGPNAPADIKYGAGGIRDLEFMIQGLQLIHAGDYPDILTGNTLEALECLARAGVLSLATAVNLQDEYTFFRRIEHCLQLFDDRQVHALPADTTAQAALARRVMGSHTPLQAFRERLAAVMQHVRRAYEEFLRQPASAGSSGCPRQLLR